ncbi:MFS transporter [Vibrio spartinae]|uniref:Major Facilitator Superfamily protein n=1 Tax=Vibrio spartinae TaxID=1918945 RepID=A0ABX6R457_9VIBR|nr:MFS transporter [Vibrio spartinae]QMV16147.1 Major Facilitator Superfamily protein [Vibrio spartinae]
MNSLNNHNRSTQLIFGQFTFAALVHFGVLAVLPVFLTSHTSLEVSTVATLLFAASVIGKLGRVFVSLVIDLLPSRNLLIFSSLVGAVILLMFPRLESAVAICTAITIFNLSNGVNSISVRSLIANMKRTTESRFLKYSKLSIATNIAAFVGPPAAFYFLTTANSISPFTAFSFLLAITSLVVFFFRKKIPDLHPQKNIVSGSIHCLKISRFRRLLVCTLISYFSYAFMYNSVALYATYHLGLKDWSGVLLGLNALVVIAITYPLNSWTEQVGFNADKRIRLGFSLYLVAFLLPVLLNNPIIFVIAVLLWALAESLMLPSLISQATVDVSESHHVAALTVYSIVVGFGEGIGVFTAVNLTTSSALNGSSGFLLAAGVSTVMLFVSRRV